MSINGPWHKTSDLSTTIDLEMTAQGQSRSQSSASVADSFFCDIHGPGGATNGPIISANSQSAVNGRPYPIDSTYSAAAWSNGWIFWYDFDLDLLYSNFMNTGPDVNPDSLGQSFIEYADFVDVDHWEFFVRDFGYSYPEGSTLRRDMTPRIGTLITDFVDSYNYTWSEDDDLGDFKFEFYSIRHTIDLVSDYYGVYSPAAAAAAGLAYGTVWKDRFYDELKAAFTDANFEFSFGPTEDESATVTKHDPHGGPIRGHVGFLSATSILLANDESTPGLALPDFSLSANQTVDTRLGTTVIRTGPTLIAEDDWGTSGYPPYIPDGGAAEGNAAGFGGVTQTNFMSTRMTYRPRDYRHIYSFLSLYLSDLDDPTHSSTKVKDPFTLTIQSPWVDNDDDEMSGVRYRIDWDDGDVIESTADLAHTHAYPQSGIYWIKVKAFDEHGGTMFATIHVVVEFTMTGGQLDGGFRIDTI
jgi:hypothetical protein